MLPQVSVFTDRRLQKLEDDVNCFLNSLEDPEDLIDVKFSVKDNADAEWFYTMVIYIPSRVP